MGLDEIATESRFFQQEHERLVREALGKWILIKGTSILGTFESRSAGLDAGWAQFGSAPFFLKLVEVSEPVRHMGSFSVAESWNG